MELLKELYRISSPSGNEKKMKKFIKDWTKRNVSDCSFKSDKFGNMYFTKGESETYPCVVAHLDEVHKEKGKDFRVIENDGILFGFNYAKKDYVGIGADDKNGIWVALNCLKLFSEIKVAFFVQEEVGCIGSSSADMNFFDDARFVLQCDRKTGNDLITNGCGVELCSKKFLNDIPYKQYGYKKTDGSLSDVITLVENGVGVSCLNIGCGYYRPHTQFEYTDFYELKNCLFFVCDIVTNCTEVYEHEYSYKSYSSYGGYLTKWDYKYKNEDIYGLKNQVNSSFWKKEEKTLDNSLDVYSDDDSFSDSYDEEYYTMYELMEDEIVAGNFEMKDFMQRHYPQFPNLNEGDYDFAFNNITGDYYSTKYTI